MSANDYESLDRFIGNWFHQDWDLEARTWQELIEKFKLVSRKERVKQVHDDLRSFLQTTKSDDELCELVFEEFGCGYDPRPEQGVREWLGDIATALKPPRQKKVT